MHRRRLLFILFPLVLAAAAPAFATSDKPVIVSARLHCLSLADPLDQLALIETKDKKIPITAPSSYLSPVYDYTGPADAVIVHTGPQAPSADPLTPSPDPAEPPPDFAAGFTLPPQGGEFLLLFAPGKQPGRLLVAPFDFSPQAVPPGYYLVWNISVKRIALNFGEAKVFVDPGHSQLVTPHAAPDTYVALRVYDEYEGKPRLIVSGRHFNRANARQIFLFSSSSNPSAPIRMKMQAITDLLPPPAPPPPPGAKPSSPDKGVAALR